MAADRTLRSAMKSTPSPTPSPQSSPSQPLPVPPLPQPSILSLSPAVSSPATTINSPLPVTSPSPSTIIGPNASQGYTPKVSFDTFENSAASMFSFTLQAKSDGYERSPSTRVFLCASSPDESGRQALDWTIESLVQDGDELVVFRGIDQDDLGRKPFIIIYEHAVTQANLLLSAERDHDVVRDEARDLLLRIQDKCVEVDSDRKLSIVVEYIAGKVTTTIDRLIALYRPDSVIVGSRGARKMKQALGVAFGSQSMGGVSKYCLRHSPVPVVVVRPESKVRKTLDKRRADPKRGIHFDE
jgi:nucleotide-binding universal stress UspA family protein